MNTIKYFLLLLTTVLVTNIYAQKCMTDHAHIEKTKKNIDFEKNQLEIKSLVNKMINDPNKDLSGDTIIIPVVFHIIHNGDPIGEQENISDDLIMNQLSQLNADFNRQNSDIGDTPITFQSVASSTEIEFCLTKINEDNQFVTGIERHHIQDLPGVSESDCWTTDYIDDNIVAPTIWDRDKFMNIYTVVGIDNFSNGSCDFFASLGYAQFPGGGAETDAVILSFFTVGSLDSPNPLIPAFLGRTATHEVGHWLGLEHLWGSRTGSCNVDDEISDTPAQFEEIFGCPDFPEFDNCTNTGDGLMYMNYMQYVDDNCMNLFTAGQREFMRTTIEVSRESLLASQCNLQVLSTQLVSDLTASEYNGDIRLDWTQQEGFYGKIFIEHGITSDALSQIDELVIEKESNTNSYIHHDAIAGVQYYRLRYVDPYGNTEYSRIVSAKLTENNLITLMPNPASEFIELTMSSDDLDWNILAADGRSLIEDVSQRGNQKIDISHLPKGVYFLSITTEENTIQIIRWLKV